MEYLMLPVASVHEFSKDISWEEAALIEPFTIAAQTLARGRVSGDDTLVIYGAGPIGLVILQGAKRLGTKVAIIDIVDQRLKMAKELGADLVINSRREEVVEKVFQFTGGEGPSVIVEAVGMPALLEQAVEMASPAARIVNLGFTSQPSQIAELPITKKELEIIGSRLHNNKFPEVIGWLERKEVQAKPLVSHAFDFIDVQEAIELMEKKPEETCKVILRLP
jgi:L-gulonate 5-dehydrogenase